MYSSWEKCTRYTLNKLLAATKHFKQEILDLLLIRVLFQASKTNCRRVKTVHRDHSTFCFLKKSVFIVCQAQDVMKLLQLLNIFQTLQEDNYFPVCFYFGGLL